MNELLQFTDRGVALFAVLILFAVAMFFLLRAVDKAHADKSHKANKSHHPLYEDKSS
jgi:hypothetical protein